jgi:DNA-directed RNA polymerase subunit M/transcription elongation factor TFIIS
MNSNEKIKIINSFQSNSLVHPLTCGINSLHRNLIPVDCGEDEVILKCLNCGYTQHIENKFIESLSLYENAMSLYYENFIKSTR